MDLSGVKSSLLLNKSAFTTDELEYFRKPVRNRKGQIVTTINTQEWQSLYDRLSTADLRKGKDKAPDVSTLIEQDSKKRSENNVIPIGILNLDATFLNEQQADENSKEKQKGKKANAEKYEKMFFIAAAVLQQNIYQAEVSFRISPDLHISNNNNAIKRLEIDFQDGKGYRAFDLKEQSILYRFTSIGERIVSLRVYTQRGTYVFNSRIDIKQLERPKIYREFTVTAKAVRQDTISTNSRLKNGRAAVSVPGANVRIVLGCDQVFDRPIIVAEGFDLVNENSLEALRIEYTDALRPFINQGYDLVLVDYHNARDFIENNAEVLKNVILQVNNEKVGNEQLTVIGISMSGLVGRWALRKMENDGIPHNVRLFIPFDTPHQGANVPVSITQIYWAANPTFLSNVFLRIFSGLRNYYSAIQTPAATQMLLHWGPPYFYLGNPHPEFYSFRTRLQAMGNGGYPQNCRNITMINGSTDASDRELFTRYGYGSNLIASRLWVPGQLAYIDAYTNQINNNSRILNFWANGFFLWGGALINYGSAFNNDFLSGGRSSFSVPQRVLNNTRSFDFCFVPTFSSIDYQGPRNTQTEREFLNVNTARNNGQTPFAAVYGRVENTIHVDAARLNWPALGISEGLLNNPGVCPTVQPPPAPNFYANSVPCLADPTTDPASVVVNLTMVGATQGQYTQSWSVQPSGQFATGSGDTFNFSVSEPGQYTVTCTRSFPNRPDLNSSTSIVVTVNYCDAGTGGQGGNNNTCSYLEGDFAYVLDNGSSVYARYHNGTLYALATVGDTYQFVSRSTLIANGMVDTFANCFSETDPRSSGGGGCASGNFAAAFDIADCNVISGWALDQNNFNRTVDVEIRVDGQLVATVQANQNRSDLVGAFGNNPAAAPHGFTYNVPANASWRNGTNHSVTTRICGATADLGGSPKTVNCTGGGGGCTPPAAPTVSANPSSISAGGSSTLSASGCGGTVNWSTGASGNTTTVSPSSTTSYTATCTQSGCTSTNSNSVTVTVGGGGGGGCASGNFAGFFDEANCSSFSGWALDQNNFGRTLDVEIRIDGQLVATVQANGSRPDLVGAFGNNPQAQYHGWSYSVPANASWRNGTNRTASARICGATNDLNNSPKTVNCTGGSGGGAACNFSTSATVNNGNVGCSGSITLNAPCTGPDCGGVSYVWSGNGLYQTNQLVTTNAPNTNGSYTYYVEALKTGCATQNNSVAVSVSGCGGGGSSTCSAENDQCSGNSSEVRNYSVTASMSGIYTIKVFYRSHEGPGVIRWQVDGGAVQTLNVAQTSINNYVEVSLGTANLSSGNRTINLSSGGGFVCFRKVCIQSGGRVGVAEQIEEPNDWTVHPNPTSGELTLQLSLEQRSDVQLNLHDLTGRSLWQRVLPKREGNVRERLWLGEVSAGFYLLTVQTNERTWTQKVVLQR